MKETATKSKLRRHSISAATPDVSWYAIANDKNQRMAKIKSLCQQIAQEYQPEKIILFGSQASGQATADSDIDLMIVMPFDGHPLAQSSRMLKQLNLLMPIDLLVSTPQNIQQRLEIGDDFIRNILEHGTVLYETHHAGMD